jgi:ATP-dependent helicase STH1/SNF2
MKRHTRPYKCTIEGCHKAFGSNNDLLRHGTELHATPLPDNASASDTTDDEDLESAYSKTDLEDEIVQHSKLDSDPPGTDSTSLQSLQDIFSDQQFSQHQQQAVQQSTWQSHQQSEVEDGLPAASEDRLRAPPRGLSNSGRSALHKSLNEVIQTIKNIEVPDSDPEEASDDDSDDGPPTRLIIGPFLKLPRKRDYPDYYAFIQEPIAIDMIEQKVEDNKYASLKELEADITLLVKNAKTYNEDGSLLFEDATVIEVS